MELLLNKMKKLEPMEAKIDDDTYSIYALILSVQTEKKFDKYHLLTSFKTFCPKIKC